MGAYKYVEGLSVQAVFGSLGIGNNCNFESNLVLHTESLRNSLRPPSAISLILRC